MDAFDSIWDRMALDGRCDARGSAEYRRVRAAWDQFGLTNAIVGFVLVTANHLDTLTPDWDAPPSVPSV